MMVWPVDPYISVGPPRRSVSGVPAAAVTVLSLNGMACTTGLLAGRVAIRPFKLVRPDTAVP